MNFRQVRKKIKVINNVAKITKTMEMVAAVKMRQAQKKALEYKPYQRILNKIIKRIVSPELLSASFFFKKAKVNQAGKMIAPNLYLLISSNKGLCGSFNFNLFKLLTQEANFQKDYFIVLGKKGGQFVSKLGGKIKAHFSDQGSLIDNVSAVFSFVTDCFIKNQCQYVFLVYNKFFSTFKAQPVKEQLLPIVDFKQLEEIEEERDYLIEPSKKEALDSLIRDYLQGRIRMAILDSEAAEHSARMVAMKNATENAAEVIYNLTLLSNRLRQESITYELLDMITAKEAAGVS